MILKEIDLFKGIDYSVMEQIADICVEETYDKGHRIFEKGEVAECLYILVEGGLKLMVENGASLTFRLTEPGTIFGWSSMAESGKYTSSGVCATDLKVVKLDGKKLDTIFKHHPEAGFQVLRRLMDVFSDRLLNSYQTHLDSLLSVGSIQAKPSYG